MTSTPAHLHIRDLLRSKMQHDWLPGTKIPSERKLENVFAASRTTINKAVAQLVSEGLLERRVGNGTFVCHRPAKPLIIRFTYYLSLLGQAMYPGHSLLLHEIKRALEPYGHELLYSLAAPNALQKAEGFCEDGNLLVGAMADSIIAEKLAGKIPLVLVDHDEPELPVDSVSLANVKSGREAAELLIRAGHTRIAYVGRRRDTNAHDDWPTSNARWEGVQEAFAASGLRSRPAYRISEPGGQRRPSDRHVFAPLLTLPEPPTAVILFSDRMVSGFLTVCRECGISVPNEVSLLSFGMKSQDQSADAIGVSLFETDWGQFGREAIRLLLRRIESPQQPIEKIRLCAIFSGPATIAPPASR